MQYHFFLIKHLISYTFIHPRWYSVVCVCAPCVHSSRPSRSVDYSCHKSGAGLAFVSAHGWMFSSRHRDRQQCIHVGGYWVCGRSEQIEFPLVMWGFRLRRGNRLGVGVCMLRIIRHTSSFPDRAGLGWVPWDPPLSTKDMAFWKNENHWMWGHTSED